MAEDPEVRSKLDFPEGNQRGSIVVLESERGETAQATVIPPIHFNEGQNQEALNQNNNDRQSNEATPLVEPDNRNTVQGRTRHHREAANCNNRTCCDALCLPFCIPCQDKGCAALWQVLAIGSAIILLGLTVYGPILCDSDEEIKMTGAIAVIPILMIFFVCITCFIHHCVLPCRRHRESSAILYFFGFLFGIVFLLSVGAESYFVYVNHKTIQQHAFNMTVLEEEASYGFRCSRLVGVLWFDVLFNYLVMFIFVVFSFLFMLYHMFAGGNSKQEIMHTHYH